ncbi:lasso peptide biosynthesis PqqD family chaperone [Paenibacillus eucommiae]|uniref:Metallophosphoesterase n=1 Tax=Paenibacillus eucommiae TaxID=1355755 RepID=A0ABS4IS51_9BACL|nr:lasso peptide biosynthesis PqqD family chaperone [Paenibacillus eucommiae]MBP1990383.1 hypothetical protein [Paenibacillus eucommiae]
MIKNKISLHDCFVQGKGNIVSNMGGEKVMLSIDNGKYYNLGEVGGRIWDMIALPVSASQIVTALMSEYHVGQEECEQQVLSFLELLMKEGLIQSE